MGRQMDLPSMAEFKKILGLTAAFLAFPIGMSIFAAKSSFLTWSPQFYMGTLAFFSLVMAQFAVLCFAASALLDDDPPSVVHPFDTERGVLGWLNPVPARLPVQLWLALVVDLAGNLGFIVVMKFVPALTSHTPIGWLKRVS